VSRSIVEFRPQVTADLHKISAYIAKDNSAAALSFVEAIESTLDLLALNPELGSQGLFKHPRLSNFRFLPVKNFPNYLIFYEVLAAADQKVVAVVRILHSARNIEGML
jgi:toxin ParE1/3/4